MARLADFTRKFHVTPRIDRSVKPAEALQYIFRAQPVGRNTCSHFSVQLLIEGEHALVKHSRRWLRRTVRGNFDPSAQYTQIWMTQGCDCGLLDPILTWKAIRIDKSNIRSLRSLQTCVSRSIRAGLELAQHCCLTKRLGNLI